MGEKTNGMMLSIIIVSFNTKDILLGCLDSIYKNISNDISYEVIVVDNASTDGTREIFNSQFFPRSGIQLRRTIFNQKSNFKFIQNEKNFGFSKSNNLGVKKAKGKYLLFLNSDTLVYQGTIETMLAFMDTHRDCGASTCRVELPNGSLDDASHRGFPTPWNAICYFSGLSKIFPHLKLFSGYNLTWMDLSKPHEIDALAGAFMLVRKDAGEQVEWWDEDYFFYGEDLDFCYRLKEEGWKVFFVPEVKILHYKGVSAGLKKVSAGITKADKETKIRATNARFDAMKIFYQKHYKNRYPKWLSSFIMLGVDLKKRAAIAAISS